MTIVMSQELASFTIPIEPLIVLDSLRKSGFVGYIVGGAVRDLLRQEGNWLTIDFDLTTNATPQELLTIFPSAFYENSFGTVSLTYEDVWNSANISDEYRLARKQLASHLDVRKTDPRLIDLVRATKIHASLLDQNSETRNTESEQLNATLPLVEITTFRSGETYSNGPRKPTEVQWGKSILQDLERRDFTINALALKIDGAWISQILAGLSTTSPKLKGYSLPIEFYQVLDHHHGLDDLDNKIIRTVGTASNRFSEDALRMLRAIRFAVQLGFELETETHSAIQLHADLITQVSNERIRDEFLKMITSPKPKQAIELLDSTGMLKHILPELLLAKGVAQGGHHTTDVWTHSIDALEACPSSDPIVRLATLLHDIAKPQTYAEKNGAPTFYNHEVVGARVAKNIGQRLRLSKKDCERLFILVRNHMFHYQPENSDASIRRFMRTVGLDNIDDILDLRESDRLGSGARKTSWRLEEMKERMLDQLNQPLDVTDLAVDGHDLMQALSLKPGRELGTLLKMLFEHILDNPDDNQKEILLNLAQTFRERLLANASQTNKSGTAVNELE